MAEPSPLGPVEPVGPPGVQAMVDAVPPSTCESTVTVRSVSGVLLKLTVSPAKGLPAQVARLSTVTVLSPSPA